MLGFPALHDTALHERGLTGRSLVDAQQRVWLPYDVVREERLPDGLRAIGACREVLCARDADFELPRDGRPLHVLNGMGVALGDAIMGLSVLHAVHAHEPRRRIVMHPAAHLPASVAGLLDLARFADIAPLPIALDTLPEDAVLVDLGDFAYWPRFDHMPMHDFFAAGLGLNALPESAYRNAWLEEACVPELPAPWDREAFVLFAPLSSSPLRNLSESAQHRIVAQAAAQYGLPVLGFTRVAHPAYRCIADLSPDTPSFLAWVRSARVLISTDSAAVHAAAGFDVPNLVGFVSGDPAVLVARYPRCVALDLRTPELDGRHFSEEPAHLAIAQAAWDTAIEAGLPWPQARD
ncbi:hypothetical protein [Niveibacterium sp. SC-1]|uniref:hypothetical protein n=1 Tax=Niveibacterium sp. SC-1 TaxID=3135646 RepID=UPI00311D3099